MGWSRATKPVGRMGWLKFASARIDGKLRSLCLTVVAIVRTVHLTLRAPTIVAWFVWTIEVRTSIATSFQEVVSVFVVVTSSVMFRLGMMMRLGVVPVRWPVIIVTSVRFILELLFA